MVWRCSTLCVYLSLIVFQTRDGEMNISVTDVLKNSLVSNRHCEQIGSSHSHCYPPQIRMGLGVRCTTEVSSRARDMNFDSWYSWYTKIPTNLKSQKIITEITRNRVSLVQDYSKFVKSTWSCWTGPSPSSFFFFLEVCTAVHSSSMLRDNRFCFWHTRHWPIWNISQMSSLTNLKHFSNVTYVNTHQLLKLRKECDVVRKKTAACILDVLTFVVFTCRYRRQDMSKYPALASLRTAWWWMTGSSLKIFLDSCRVSSLG